MSSVTIGSLVMSRQAAIILISGLAVSVSMMLKGMYTEGLAMSIFVAVNSYVVNCMTVGHCDTYAWVLAIVTLIFNILGLFFNKKMFR